jgi:hypothetical protein
MPATKPTDKKIKQEAAILYATGLGPTAIAAKYAEAGLKPSTVQKWITRFGWRELRANNSKEIGAATLRTVQKSISELDQETRRALAVELSRSVGLLVSTPAKGVSDLGNTPQRQGRSAIIKSLSDAAGNVFGWEAGKTTQLVQVSFLAGAGLPSQGGKLQPTMQADSIYPDEDPATAATPAR